MNRAVPAILLSLLAGCAFNAGTLRQKNPPLVYTSRQNPPEVAACVARNMEKFLFAAQAGIHPLASGNGLEVLATGSDHTVYAVTEVTGVDGGSAVSMWFSPIIRMLRGPQESGMKFMLDC